MNELDTFFSENWWWIIAISFWSLAWKGWALWRAGRNNDKTWFIVLLLVNTVGILDMFYIFIFSKKNKSSDE